MKRERRSFDKDFKQMAVNLCLTGKPTKEVAEEGISSELIRRWKREYGQYQGGSFSGHGNANLTEEQKENVRLKKAWKEA
ncbi:MAG: transposase [Bacteroidia bacterium]|jgi:transposase